MRNTDEIRKMIYKLWDIEANAPSYCKGGYQAAAEVLEWVLGEREEDEVVAFGED